MKESRRKHSSVAYIALWVMLFTMLPGISLAAGTTDTKKGSKTVFCESYRTEMGKSSRNDSVLIICPEGVGYKTASMQAERLIPWKHIDRWRYLGAEGKGAKPGTEEYTILRIVPTDEWGGFGDEPRYYHDLEFKICCSSVEEQRVLEGMNKYLGDRRF